MTSFTVPRGQARALWASLLPHAGRQSEDTPEYGRVRFAPGGTELVAWTTDGATQVAAFVDVLDHDDDGAEVFDLATGALKAALAVFRGPSDADARAMWEDQALQVVVGPDTVELTEVGDIVEGRSLTVERIVLAGEDRYPDVPRTLAVVGEPDPAAYARVTADALARFVPSAKAWGGRITATVVRDPQRLEVRVGGRLYGVCPSRPQAPEDRPVDAWSGRLTPLMRPATPAPVVTLHVVDGGGRP